VNNKKNLLEANPEIAAEWHPTKNGEITPDDVVAGSNKVFWWKCPKGPDHEWPSRLSNRTCSGRGCRCCAGWKVSVTNSLATLYPEIAAEWHPTKNGKITPDDVVAGSHTKYWWKCPEGPDHEWPAKLSNRTSNNKRGCPCCAGIKISVTNSLATLYPEIAAEWHPTKNGEITPDDVTAGSDKNIWWKCPKGPDHEWPSRTNNRTSNKRGCPFCNIVPRSKQEIYLAFELLKFIDFDIDEHKIKNKNKIYDVDIIIKKHKIIIEFDGSYWHKDKVEADLAKTKTLADIGWHVIRVREMPLKKITSGDVVFRASDIKQAADKTLSKIDKSCDIELSNLKSYMKRKTLINKKSADVYIDKLLAEKFSK